MLGRRVTVFRVLVEQFYENIKCDDMDCKQLAEERDMSCFVLNMVVNILETLGNFLTS